MPSESSEVDFYAALFNAAEDAIIVHDGVRFIDCNRAALELLKFPSKADFLTARPADVSARTQPNGSASYALAEKNVVYALEQGSCRFDWLIRDVDDSEFLCDVCLTRFEWRGHALLRATIRPENRELERRRAHVAHHDVLTGLPNRALFRGRAEAAMNSAWRSGTSFAVFSVDLDRFKTINDSLGRAAGDRILRGVVERFSNAVGTEALIARVGGNEFALLFEDIANPRQAAVVARKLIASLDQPIAEDGIELNVSACIGISLYPTDGHDVDALLSHADAAMHATKEGDRNNYRFFSPEMNSSTLESLILSNDMHTALQRGEFALHYQPVINLENGDVTGFEALLRWYHPKRGTISPAEFIPVAEETGLVTPLGEWVMAEACRQMREWLRTAGPGLRMAINLSAMQFREWGFVERIGGMLEQSDLTPDQLLIEITESIMLPDSDQTCEILKEFSRMGLPVAIDDFGTGYSSLAYLRDFSIDYLKIDRSFVNNVPHDQSACTIVSTMIAMAQNLGLKVVAEGVETPEQLAFLRKNGCDEAQGYYLGMPMPASQAKGLLNPGTSSQTGQSRSCDSKF